MKSGIWEQIVPILMLLIAYGFLKNKYSFVIAIFWFENISDEFSRNSHKNL